MKKIILLLAFAVMPHWLFAAPKSSVAWGSGGGGVASVEAGESSFMNPGTLVHLKGAHFFSTFQKDLWAVSLIENDKDTVLPGAVSYVKSTENDIDSQIFGLTASQMLFENFAAGLTLNYWQSAPENTDIRRESAFNGTVGMVWTPNTIFGLGASFENIAPATSKFKRMGLMAPVTRFGMNYIYKEWFRTRLDLVTYENNDFSELMPQAGMETYFGKWFILRLGWNKPPELRESWSAGFGLDLPRFRVDYASAWNVNGTKESRHSVDLAIPF